MTSRPEITSSSKMLFEQNRRIAASPSLLPVAYERSVRGLRRDFVKELATPLGAHKRPTDFETPKQRRWWFAVGVKLWRGRTGTTGKGWRTDIKTTTRGGLFRYWNVVPTWIFIQGARVQRMHRNVWRQLGDAVPKYQALAQERLAQTWHTIVDPQAGVR